MKRALWLLLTPTAIVLALWLVIDFAVMPRLMAWAKEEAEQYTARADSPVRLTIGEIHGRIFPPRLRAANVRVEPVGELTETLSPVTLRSLHVSVNAFDLVFGRFQLVRVVLSGLEGELHVDPLMESDEPAKPLPIAVIFSWSDRIPLTSLEIDNSRLRVSSKKHELAGEVRFDQVILQRRSQALVLHVLSELQLDQFEALALGTQAHIELTPRELRLRRLHLKRDDLIVSIEGRAPNPAQLPVRPELTLTASTQIPLNRLVDEIRKVDEELHLPPVTGLLKARTQIELKGSSQFRSAVRLETQAVQVDNFQVGDATVEGTLTSTDLVVNSVDIRHPAGSARLGQTKIAFQSPFAFQTQVNLQALDLQKLFQSLDLHEIPVDLDVRGELPCQGSLDPFEVSCRGKASGRRLLVRNENKPSAFTIVELNDLGAEGEVTVNTKEVRFKGDVSVDGSRGSSEGVVNFDTGFKILYQTPQLQFRSVKNLAGLKFEGQAAIEGSTEGNTETASFDMNIRAKDFVFEDYTLGDVTTDLKLRKGHLIFEELRQNIGRSRTVGSMDIDLNHDTLAGEFASDQLEAEDLIKVFSRHWMFPLELQTRGNAQMTFYGPLNFWKLNYDLKAQFGPGRLHGDSFDALSAEIRAEDGNISIGKAEGRKGASIARATGGISSDQVMNIKMEGTNLRLEDSELVNQVQNNLSGALNLSADLNGPITQPDLNVRGSVSDMFIDENEIASSFFDLKFRRDHFEGQATLLGNKIQTDLRIPYAGHHSPLRIRAKTSDWAFTNLLLLIGAGNLNASYESSLTSELQVESPVGDWDRLEGHLQVKDVLIRRGESILKNRDPIEAEVRAGSIRLKNALLEGPGESRIEVRGESFRLNRLNLGVSANASLRLLHLLAPFLEDLGGQIQAEASVGGSIFKPEVLGNASITDGFIKLKGFPHPVERLRTDIVFSQNRVLIQNLKSNMAGGSVTGDGNLLINRYGDMPMHIRLQARDLSLNVPDKVRSNGNADLLFSGRWFPYVLSGRYTVASALVEKEFTDEAGGGGMLGTRAHSYLPKILKQAQFDPVVLDLAVQLDQNVAVRNSMMDGQVSGNIQIKGPPESPVLIGRINTEKNSRIIIKEKSFELLTGTVNFNNPEEVNPELYLSAQARINEYDVSVLVQGTAKNPLIRMTSLPPLSEQDIVSLLALGITSQKLEGQGESQQRAQVGYEALGFGLSRTGTSKMIEKATGFNIAITSTFDQSKNISVPKLTFTRKLSDRLSASYARPVNGDTSFQEFKLNYQINNNWSTIGSYEEREGTGASLNDANLNKTSIFGLDLEFKREFK